MKRKLYIKQVLLIFFFISLCFIISISLPKSIHFFQQEAPIPTNGLWFCDELQIQLSFNAVEYSPDETLEDYETYTYVMTSEGCIMCSISLPIRGRQDLSLVAQDSNYMNLLGKTLFEGTVLRLENDCYVIEGKDGVEYSFRKIGVFSAGSYLENRENQTECYAQDIFEKKYVGQVTDFAIALWLEHLGLESALAKGNVTACYDVETNYWLISLRRSNDRSSFMALISANGDYASIWTE